MDLYLLQKYLGEGQWKVVKVTNESDEATLWDMSGDDSAVLKMTLTDLAEGRTLLMDIDQGLWVFEGEDKNALNVLSPAVLPMAEYETRKDGSISLKI